MDDSYLELSYPQVALATLLVLINGALSFLLGLGLGRRLLVAAGRTVVQLLLVGLLLQHVFALRSPLPVLGLMLVMTVIAGVSAVRRTTQRYPGIWWNSLLSVWFSSWVLTGVAVTAIVRVDPWYLPQYVVPLLGMILGNALNGVSLGLDRLGDGLRRRRREVEMRLSLGATRFEAAHPVIREAVRAGTIPILNAMSVAGLVSLPGMMTGQLLAGVDPAQAVRYQIVIMFLIASGTALGTVGVVMLGFLRLFNRRHQFLYERLGSPGT